MASTARRVVSDQGVILSGGTALPSSVPGHAPNAIFLDTDATGGEGVYCNTGTFTSATWSTLQATALVGVTAGLVTASKAIVVDANKDIGDFRNLDVVNLDAGLSGTAGSLDIFPATAAKGKIAIACADQTGNTTLTITNEAQGQATSLKVPDVGAAAGQFVCTNADFTVLIAPGGADRTLTLGGGVTTSGNVTLAGALTTGAALEFSGAFAAVIVVPSASTWTLPTGGGTLALATGGETGTTNSSFTVDSDSANAKLALDTNAATGNFTLKQVPANLTANRTVTFQDATGTVVLRDSTDTLSGKTLTAPVFNGCTTAAAANNFTLDTGSGAFTTPTGTFTHYGAVANNGNITWTWSSSGSWDMSGSIGTFLTPTGATTIGGAMTMAAGKAIAIGTAAGGGVANGLKVFSATANKGELRLHQPDDANNKITTIQANNAAANAVVTLPNATATVATLLLAETLDAKTLTAAGDITQTGATTIQSGTTGIIIPDANTAGLSIHAANVQGSIRVKATNMGADTILDITNEAQTQATTFKIPDLGAVATGQFVCSNADFTVVINPNAADRTVSLSGNVTTAAAFTTATAAVTLTANAAGSSVTLPQSGTLASLAGTEALTNKTIDGDSNTISDIGASSPKAGVEGLTATPVTPSIPFMLTFQPITGAGETLTYTVPAGKTLRVLDVRGYKTVGAGGAGDTVTVKNAGTNITDAIVLNIADKAVFAAATIDDAQRNVAAAAALQVVTAFNTSCACSINILCMWV